MPSEPLRICIARLLTWTYRRPISCDDEIVYKYLGAIKPPEIVEVRAEVKALKNEEEMKVEA